MAAKRLWPPEEDEVGGTLAPSDGAVLGDWCACFEVTLANVSDAQRFASQYRQHFPSAAATHRGQTAWVLLRLGATDGREAEVLAAMSVKIAADLRFVGVSPLAARLHFVDLIGPLWGQTELRRRRERQGLVEYARRLSLRGLAADPTARAARHDGPTSEAELGPGDGDGAGRRRLLAG